MESFPALDAVAGLAHLFTRRVPDLEVDTRDKAVAVSHLEPFHRAAQSAAGMDGWPRFWGEQVHGAEVAVIDDEMEAGAIPMPKPMPMPLAGVDGVVTARKGVALGVYVADCAAVYLVDPEREAIGLVHSGRKGTELGIATVALKLMRERLGCRPESMVAVISPCIRPPNYEVDFAATIREQCRAAGLAGERIHDDEVCTGANLSRYYSYRMEQGRTGRMLALLGWQNDQDRRAAP